MVGHVKRPPRIVACSHCTRPTDEPRRGLCQGCYLREFRGHVRASACVCCGYSDARALRRHRLEGEMRTLCAICSAIAGRRPITLDALRLEVRRPAGRRVGERRVKVSLAWVALADRRKADRRAA